MGSFARIVLVIDLALVTVAGIQLYVLSERTAAYFAWTIKAPITAAFLGAGYWSTIPSLVLSLRSREWGRVRIMLVMGVVLTGFTALATVWHVKEFHLGEGSWTARAAAWSWLVVYLTVPLLLLAAIVREERAGGSREYDVEAPLRPALRVLFLVEAVGLTVLGLGLAVWPDVFDVLWPWPLSALPAGAVGAWLLTVAAGCWWCLRDGDWRRVRVAFPALLTFLVLLLVGAARYAEAFDADDSRTWVYLLVVAASALLFALAALSQERATRGAA